MKLVGFFAFLVEKLSYLGVFLVAFMENATVVAPLPVSTPTVFALASFLNPVGIAIAAALGATLGETIAYLFGYCASKAIEKKSKEKMEAYRKKFGKLGEKITFLIFVFAATPLPDDVIGIYCGSINYPLKKFLLPLLIGKLVLYLSAAFFGDVVLQGLWA